MPVVEPRELTVAAASDLKFVLVEIIAEFEKEHPDVQVKPTYGSSGSFFAQLSNRAPFDLFLSADIAYPRKLVESGLASDETLFSYAIGQIVVWVPNASPLDIEAAGSGRFQRCPIQKIAIANPGHAPHGRDVVEVKALKELGV